MKKYFELETVVSNSKQSDLASSGVMVCVEDLERWSKEMLFSEWSNKRRHNPQMHNGWRKRPRRDLPSAFQVAKEMAGDLYFQTCKILLVYLTIK